MPVLSLANEATWVIAAMATLGVIVRPWGLPEAIWAVAGAALLGLGSLLPWHDLFEAVARGTDVYLFLVGMMLLAELARREGLFDCAAALAAQRARGSASRLFALVYAVGVLVTMLLSNDATAVVLTPAVAAVARTARARPLPYLFACAFIANAASFLLPISNPANLVVFGQHMPPLSDWLARFGLPSVLAISATYVVLRMSQRRQLADPVSREVRLPPLSAGGRLAAAGIGVTALVLLAASAAGVSLGLPTVVAGVATVVLALLRERRAPWPLLAGVSWGILPLVAGLFVLVQGLEHTGLLATLSQFLQTLAHRYPARAGWLIGVSTALACNVTNNLPVGLVVGQTLRASPLSPSIANAMLIAVDLGPNLSVTGSLATILWLLALRREGEQVSAGRFLRLGVLVMLPALLLALAAAIGWGGT